MLLIKYEVFSLVVAIVLGLIALLTKGKEYGSITKCRWVIHLYAMSILGIELVIITICALYDYRGQFLVGILSTAVSGIYLVFVGGKNLIGLNEYDQFRKNHLEKIEIVRKKESEASIP